MSSAVATPEPGMLKIPARAIARPIAPVSAFMIELSSGLIDCPSRQVRTVTSGTIFVPRPERTMRSSPCSTFSKISTL
jgi:hypothetical protein